MKSISLVGIFFFGLSIACFSQNADSGSTGPAAGESKYPVETGIASWYGPEFAGKPTASGELFDPRALTAAHPTLPFGTLVRVTNKNNGKQVTVRINDRGPFVANRNIDLSQAAAEQLDMRQTGTIPVTLEVLPSAGPKPAEAATATAATTVSPPPPTGTPSSAPPRLEGTPTVTTPGTQGTPTMAPPASQGTPAVAKPSSQGTTAVTTSVPKGKSYRIQVGSFKLSRNAVEAINRIKAVGLEPAYERFQDLYRVVVAQVPESNLEMVKAQLGSAGFTAVLIREEGRIP